MADHNKEPKVDESLFTITRHSRIQFHVRERDHESTTDSLRTTQVSTTLPLTMDQVAAATHMSPWSVDPTNYYSLVDKLRESGWLLTRMSTPTIAGTASVIFADVSDTSKTLNRPLHGL